MDTVNVSRGLGQKATGTVAGNAWTKLLTVNPMSKRRVQISICHDPSGAAAGTYLYIERVAAGASAPTALSTEVVNVVGSRSTFHDAVTGAVDYYGMNSTGAATTTNFAAQELV